MYKKIGSASLIPDFLAFVLLVIVFAGIWMTLGSAEKIGEDKEMLVSYGLGQSKEYDLVFLKTNVTFNSTEFTFADLIVSSVLNENYTSLVAEIDNLFIDPKFYWELTVYDSNDKLIKKIYKKGFKAKGARKSAGQKVLIPNFKGDLLKISVLFTEGEIFNQAIEDYDDASKIPRGSIGDVY